MKITFFICLILLLIIVQCKSKGNDSAHLTDSKSDAAYKDSILEVSYLMLSPNEVLNEIFNEKHALNPQLVNPRENAVKYISAKPQALNLGVYITDFGYLNISDNKTNVLDYFRIIRDLAQKNNIYGCFDEAIFNRIQENLTNNDSLLMISQDMYYSMIDILEGSNRQKVFALIASGALIESLYLSVMNVTKYSEYENITQKVFEQKKLIENFYALLSKYKNDPDIKTVMVQLKDLNEIITYHKKQVAKKIVKNKHSHFEVKGGEDIIVNEKSFNDFKASVLKTRLNIISFSTK